MDTRTKLPFKISLDIATCEVLKKASPTWTLKICDLIKEGDVEPKTVLDGIKRKLESANNSIILLTLQVLESIVENCGGFINDELTTKTFCDVLHNLARRTRHDGVKQKLLELIKTWDSVFGEKPKHINLRTLLNTMKADGFKFPNLQVSKGMLALYERSIQKSDMTRKRKLESVPTPTQVTSQSKLHKQEHFYFGRFTPFFPVGQATSNAASSPSGQYNHEAMMLQTIRTGREKLLQRLSKQNDLIGQNVTKVASLTPSQTLAPNKPQTSLFPRRQNKPSTITSQNKPQTNLFPQEQNKPSTITSQLQPTTTQTLPQNKPQNNLFPRRQNKPSTITSQLQPSTTQTLPQNNPQTDLFLRQQNKPSTITSQLQPSTTQTLPQNNPQTDLFPRQQNKPSTITSQLQPTTTQTLPQNKPQNNLFPLQQSKSSAITSQLQPITTQTLPQSQPQTDTVPQPEQIPLSTSTLGETRSVRLTQKEKLELMRKKKQEFLKKQRELATQGNQEQ